MLAFSYSPQWTLLHPDYIFRGLTSSITTVTVTPAAYAYGNNCGKPVLVLPLFRSTGAVSVGTDFFTEEFLQERWSHSGPKHIQAQTLRQFIFWSCESGACWLHSRAFGRPLLDVAVI